MIYQNQENMFGRNANGKRKFLLEAEVQKQQFPKIRKKKEIKRKNSSSSDSFTGLLKLGYRDILRTLPNIYDGVFCEIG